MRFSMALSLAATLYCGVAVRAVDAQEQKEAGKFEQLTTGKTKSSGMWNIYHKDQQLLVEMKDGMLGREYIVLPSIAKGVSFGDVIGGMSWGFGDDVIWTFRKSEDKLFVIRRNVRYRAKPQSPEASAVEIAYSDSVLYALPILTTTPGGILVDMTRVFMNDDLQIGRSLGGFNFAADRSTVGKVKAFADNVELQIAAVYSGSRELDTVVDSRGVSVGVHYSISVLPTLGSNGYKTREADDRVGYFMTVLKDFSTSPEDEHFVRYINRWDVRKKDSSVKFSPPMKPIRFYLERTVPVALRPTVKAGILEWNKAFEKLGFAGAIEVWQQEDNDTWDPEDIHYNTFRWITAEAGFAMGPSRVDPRTGQILDADIIFDAGFLKSWKQSYETLIPQAAHGLAENWSPFETPFVSQSRPGGGHAHKLGEHCSLCQGMQWQMGFAAAALAAKPEFAAEGGALPEEFIHQGLKEVVMHEVGHTLGLRHNFKASAWKTIEEMSDPEKGQAEGTVASVMDYAPPNIVPKGAKQGLFYTQTIGPYDYWAIEYGYSPLSGDEKAELTKIAAKSGQPGLDYGTDEDTRPEDSDPLSNRFDLGKDPLEFVKRQMTHSVDLLPEIVNRSVKDGQGYQRARQAFGLLFGEYWRAAQYAARFPGGVTVNRDHKGTPNARIPFQPIEPGRQREAMKLVVESAFAAPKIDGPSLNYLAATRWNHWGLVELNRLDYPIHATVEKMQARMLRQLVSPLVLNRIVDSEFKVADGQDAYTLAEHLKLLVDGVFSELRPEKLEGEYSNRKPMISSFRRNLQRLALEELFTMLNSDNGVPEDARTLTRMHLQTVDGQIKTLLEAQGLKLDDYTRAHLMDSQSRIRAALNATVTVSSGSSSGATIIRFGQPDK